MLAVKEFINKELWAPILLIFLVLIVFSPLLFGGKMFYDEEQIGFYYPQSYFFQQELDKDSNLLWNNAYFGGVSVSFDQFVSTHYPVNRFLFTHFNFFNAHHISIVFAVLIMTLFSYWLGRTAGLLPGSSVMLACSYLLAVTFGWLDIGTLAAHAFLVYPILFLAILKIDQGKSFLLYSLIGGLGLATGFLAGFMQIIFYLYFISFLFAVYLDWQRMEAKSWSERSRCTIGLVVISLIGITLGWPQILPSVLLIGSTIRNASYAAEHAYFPGLDEFVTLLLPDYIHVPFFGGGSAGMYIGPIALFAGLWGIVYARNRLSRFLLGAYLSVLGLAFHIPVFSWFNENIPPFSNFGGQFRWMVAGTLPIAFLGAIGFDSLVRKDSDSFNKRFTSYLGYFIGIFLFFFILVGLFASFLLNRDDLKNQILETYFNGRTMSFPREHYINVLNTALQKISESFSLSDWRFLVPLFLVTVSYFLLKRFLSGQMSREFFYKVSIVLICINVLLVFVAQYRDSLVNQDLVDNTPTVVREITKREKDPNSYRIAGLMLGDIFFWEVNSKVELSPIEMTRAYLELLTNNSNVLYGIQRMDGMEPYRTARHNQLISTVLFPPDLKVFDDEAFLDGSIKLDRLNNTAVLKTVSLDQKISNSVERLPLLSMLNIKYLYSLTPLTEKNLQLVYSGQLLDYPVEIYLYENKLVLPRIYLSKEVNFVDGSDEDVLSELIKIKDFRQNTLLECQGCPKTSSSGNIKILEYKNGLVKLEVESRGGSWLVFSESLISGWIATIDGQEVPIYPANYIFQGVYVPHGTHDVVFEYKDITSLKWKSLVN